MTCHLQICTTHAGMYHAHWQSLFTPGLTHGVCCGHMLALLAQGVDDPTILNAVGWCIKQRDEMTTRIGRRAKLVVSMSLGGPGISDAANAYYNQLAADDDVLVIAASGNYGPGSINYPAYHSTVMSVGAVDRFNNTADFSSSNDDVEIAAAGVDVMSWYAPTSPNYASVSLTRTNGAPISIPAPMAAGMWGRSPVTGRLVNCGLATSRCPRISGSICLVDRGSNTFCQKVGNRVAWRLLQTSMTSAWLQLGYLLSGYQPSNMLAHVCNTVPVCMTCQAEV